MMTQASISDGRARTVNYATNLMGEVVKRWETAIGTAGVGSAAGISAGGLAGRASAAVSGALGGTDFAAKVGTVVGGVVTGMADAVGNAAARSLIDGTDFGDNVRAAIPSVLGNAIAGGFFAGNQQATADENARGNFIDRFSDGLLDGAGQFVKGIGNTVTSATRATGDFLGFDGEFGYQGPLNLSRNFSVSNLGEAFSRLRPQASVSPGGSVLDAARLIYPDADYAESIPGDVELILIGGGQQQRGGSPKATQADPLSDVKARMATGLRATPGYSAGVRGYNFVTPEELASGLGVDLKTARERAPYLNDAMYEAGIDIPEEQAAFLAQTSVETGKYTQVGSEDFRYRKARAKEKFPSLRENPRFADYLWEGKTILPRNKWEEFVNFIYDDANRGPRFRLGNTQKGDGWRFQGRGYIQVTGRDNYAMISRITGVDFLSNPDWVNDPRYAARAGAAFFVGKSLDQIARTGNIEKISNKVATDLASIDRRTTAYNAILRVLNRKGK